MKKVFFSSNFLKFLQLKLVNLTTCTAVVSIIFAKILHDLILYIHREQLLSCSVAD